MCGMNSHGRIPACSVLEGNRMSISFTLKEI